MGRQKERVDLKGEASWKLPAKVVPSSACPRDGRKPAVGQQRPEGQQKATGSRGLIPPGEQRKQPTAFLRYHKNAMAFYGWAPQPDFWLLQCLVLLRFILRSSPSMKWISAFPGLNCPHQLKALPVMKIHPLFLSGKKDNSSAKSSFHFIGYQPRLFPRTSDVKHKGCWEAGGC